MRNRYRHFDAKKYDINVKIAKVRTGEHCKYNINYHLIWIPKYRRRLLTGRVREVLADILKGQCDQLGLKMLALEIMPDHIHLFVAATPNHRPAEIVKQLKGNTSIQLRRVFKELRHLNWNTAKVYPNLWARGYYCGSAGHVSQDAVKRYILEQQGVSVFDYPIFGDAEKRTKVGDFTQKKLAAWRPHSSQG